MGVNMSPYAQGPKVPHLKKFWGRGAFIACCCARGAFIGAAMVVFHSTLVVWFFFSVDWLKTSERKGLYRSERSSLRYKPGLEKTRVFFCKKPNPVGFFNKTRFLLGFLGLMGFMGLFRKKIRKFCMEIQR